MYIVALLLFKITSFKVSGWQTHRRTKWKMVIVAHGPCNIRAAYALPNFESPVYMLCEELRVSAKETLQEEAQSTSWRVVEAKKRYARVFLV